jgi:hypothetical protein
MPTLSGGNSRVVTSTTKSSQNGHIARPNRKKNLTTGEEDDTSEDGSHPVPAKRLKIEQGKKSLKTFACPYLKRDPIKYRECCGRKLSRIQDVKQPPKRYCQVCQGTNFSDKQSLQAHIDIGKCSWRDPTTLIGISYEQRDQLHRKSKSGISEEEQWFVIWEILFPVHKRPSSVYMDTSLSLEMRQFRDYCENRGPAMISAHIESDPACLSSEITENQRRLLDILIAQGLNTLFDDWRSNNSSPFIAPEPLGNGNPHRLRNSTPTSSIVDSGVAMGAHVLPERPGPKEAKCV